MKSALPMDVFWRGFSGLQRHFSIGDDEVRRFAPGFSPIVAFRDPQNPSFETVAALVEQGEAFYVDLLDVPPPAGWTQLKEARMLKMAWDAPAPNDPGEFGAIPLTDAHAAQALELALLTNPGPFGIRTIELGDYFGVFEGDRLIAMTGERLELPGFREVSGVCTHPDAQGRGLAGKLMRLVIRRQLERGQIPFLNVMSANETATGLYQRMGFKVAYETTVRVLAKE